MRQGTNIEEKHTAVALPQVEIRRKPYARGTQRSGIFQSQSKIVFFKDIVDISYQPERGKLYFCNRGSDELQQYRFVPISGERYRVAVEPMTPEEIEKDPDLAAVNRQRKEQAKGGEKFMRSRRRKRPSAGFFCFSAGKRGGQKKKF